MYTDILLRVCEICFGIV